VIGRVVRAAAVDITPLRESAEFRRLFAGQAVSPVGTQVTRVAVARQVYAITRSSLDVGLIGLASFLPVAVFGLLPWVDRGRGRSPQAAVGDLDWDDAGERYDARKAHATARDNADSGNGRNED